MRVEMAHHVADYAHTFGEPGIGTVTTVIHGIQNPPVYRLQTIPHFRQGTPYDHTHRIIQVGALHLGF